MFDFAYFCGLVVAVGDVADEEEVGAISEVAVGGCYLVGPAFEVVALFFKVLKGGVFAEGVEIVVGVEFDKPFFAERVGFVQIVVVDDAEINEDSELDVFLCFHCCKVF